MQDPALLLLKKYFVRALLCLNDKTCPVAKVSENDRID